MARDVNALMYLECSAHSQKELRKLFHEAFHTVVMKNSTKIHTSRRGKKIVKKKVTIVPDQQDEERKCSIC